MQPHTTRDAYVPSLHFLCLLVLTALLSLPLGAQGGQWTQVSTMGSTPEKRHESAFVRVGDLFYLMGGRGNKRIQVYDPATKGWSNTGTFLNDIHHFQAQAYGGKIYLLGALTGGYPAENPLTNVLIYDPQQDKLTTGATIPANRRRGSSGVVLYNGVFYIVAGNRNGHSAFLADGTTPANVSWTDKYDPLTNVWTVLPNAPHARDHFFAEVIDDKLYVAGGRRSKFGAPAGTFSDTEKAVDVFDLTTEKWLGGAALPAPLPTARAGAPTAVVNNELLVIGGEVENNPPNNLALAVTEVLNPATGTWRRAEDLVLQRHATQAIVYEGGVYLAAGSKTKGGTEITSGEVFMEAFSYNGLGGTDYPNWTTINQSPVEKSEAQLVTYGGEYYVFTGFKPNIKIANTVDKYNPAANTWTSLAPMPTVGGKTTAVTHQGIAVVDDKVWLVGGRVGDNPGPVTDAVWIYNITDNSWSKGPSLPLRRGGGGLGRLGRKLHYVGGFDENASCDVDIHLVYDLDQPAAGWQDYTNRSPMPMPRVHFGTVVYGGKLYTVGGQNGHDGCGGGVNNKLMHVYDPATDQWTRLADLPGVQSHIEPGTFVHNNKIVVVGGQTNGKTVWEYDPASNKWTVIDGMALPLALLAPGARVYGGDLYVVNGGAPGTGTPINTTRVKQYTAAGSPALAFNPGSLNISLNGTQQKKAEVILSNLNGEQGAPFRIATDGLPGWLSIDRANGYARESFTEIEVTASSAGLANGTYSHTLTATSAGYRSATLTIKLTVTGADQPGTPGGEQVSTYLEAECAAVGTLWQTKQDNAASGGSYVTITAGNNSYDSAPTDVPANRVRFITSTKSSGSYRLFARLKAPSGQDDSFWVRVNGGGWIKYWQNLETGTAFAWREVLGSPFALPAGEVTIDFAYREDGTQLDKLYLTNSGVGPSGMGGAATNCGAPTPAPDPTPATAIRINAGGPALTHQGEQFAADGNFNGGKAYTNTAATVPVLYQTERSSNAPFQYSYRVPVPNGQYTVRLHFAEIYFGANGGGPSGTGRRIFDVTLEDNKVLDNYDINADVGPQTVVVKEYSVQVTDGAVDLFFDASSAAGGTDQPKLSALEVIGQSSQSSTPTATTELWAEAECTTTGSNWSRVTNGGASQGAYLVYPGNANKPAPQGNNSAELLSYTVNLTEGGSYRLYVRMNTPVTGATGKNSFWVSVDDGSWIKFWRSLDGSQLLTDGFAWREVNDNSQPVNLSLSPGQHTIRVAPRESGTQLDKLYLGKQASAPSGLGKEATNCGSGSSATGNFAANTFSAREPELSATAPSLSLYPNPVTDRLAFKLSGAPTASEAQVLDLYGRVVLRQAIAGRQQGVSYLDVANLPRATYYLRIVGEGLSPQIQSFVKQ